MFARFLAIPAAFVTPDGQRLSHMANLFLLLFCVASFTPGMVTMPPTDRDESSFAQASKQMIETGNYIDIRLQQEPRYKKPIGIYWLQSAAARILNPHHIDEIWAYRMPSLAGATLAVLMTAALGALLWNPATGLLAAMMMAGCVLLNVEARLAKTDAALLGCIVTAIYAMAWAYVAPASSPDNLGRGTRFRHAVLFWTAVACGVLIKGPIILLPVCGVLLWLKITDGNIAWFRILRPWAGITYALALISPWFIAISLQSHGAFLQQSAGQDLFAKLWQGQNRGIMPPGAHLLALPVLFFPFSLFVIFALPDIWKNRHDRAVKFCLGWAVPTWIVFELSLTKLPHYVLPAYPALALLAAKFLLDGLPTVTHTTRRLSIPLIVGFWLMIGTGYALVFTLLPVFSDQRWEIPQIAAGIILILSQGLALFLLPRRKIGSFIMLSAGGLIFITTVFGFTLPRLQHVWMSREIVNAAAAIKPCAQSRIVAVGYHEPSLAFMAGTDTIMAGGGNEAASLLKQDPCRIVAIDEKNKPSFLDGFTGMNSQPQSEAAIQGLNSGHGGPAALTLYTLQRGLPDAPPRQP